MVIKIFEYVKKGLGKAHIEFIIMLIHNYKVIKNYAFISYYYNFKANEL